MHVTHTTEILKRLRELRSKAGEQYYNELRGKRREAMDMRKWLFMRTAVPQTKSAVWDVIGRGQLTDACILIRKRCHDLAERLNQQQQSAPSAVDYTDEISAVEAYMCAHAHSDPTESSSKCLTILDHVWIYLCHLYCAHTGTRAKVRTFQDLMHAHCALSTPASALAPAPAAAAASASVKEAAPVGGREVLEAELRRRMIVFHLGGLQDYRGFTDEKLLKAEEERRAAHVIATAASKKTASSTLSATAVPPPPPAPRPSVPVAAASTETQGSPTLERQLLQSGDRDMLLACASLVLQLVAPPPPPPPPQVASASAPLPTPAPAFITLSAQYAWCVIFRDALLRLHKPYTHLPALVTHAEQPFRQWMFKSKMMNLSEARRNLRDFFVSGLAPAGFFLRNSRLSSTKQNASLSARMVDDLKLVFDAKSKPVVDDNIQQLLITRPATSALQYLTTPDHPAYDRVVLFLFMHLFRSETKVNFRDRYLFIGDYDITQPTAMWRLVARRPIRGATLPFLPIIIVYGHAILVRMGHRMYRCNTLEQAAITWCVLVHEFYEDVPGSRARLTEDGKDLAPFLALVLPKGATDASAKRSRVQHAEMLAELSNATYPHELSDDDKDSEAKSITDTSSRLFRELSDLDREHERQQRRRHRRARSPTPATAEEEDDDHVPIAAAAGAGAGAMGAVAPAVVMQRAQPAPVASGEGGRVWHSGSSSSSSNESDVASARRHRVMPAATAAAAGSGAVGWGAGVRGRMRMDVAADRIAQRRQRHQRLQQQQQQLQQLEQQHWLARRDAPLASPSPQFVPTT
jgi:hypothetical protein